MKTLFQADILKDDYTVLAGGYLGVDGDVISYIGDTKPDGYDNVKTLKNHLLMPGLYNMHTHTSMVLLRGLGSDLPLDRWLTEAMFPIEAKLTDADISVGTRLAMMEMLASGTVSFTDMYDRPWLSYAEIDSAGIKANICRPILAFDPDEAYDKNFRVKESLDFHRDYSGKNSRIIIDFGVHAEYTSNSEVVRRYAEDCKQRGVIMHIHLSETTKEHEECKGRNGGRTPAKWFNDLGVFDSPTVAAHCVMVEPDDIDILIEKGVTAVHNPSSNMKLGSGFMPIADMISRGARLAIGTDGAASNNNLNMFEEIHLASIIHKGYHKDPTIVSPKSLLQAATMGGAAAQGRTNCGALKVGNSADIVAVNLNSPHLMPVHDVPALLAYSAQASDVAMTMVDGKILYENGEYKTIDTEKVRADLKNSVARLFG